jgi:hypothetical protein
MEPLDGFWERIYSVAGILNCEITVESFVDRQTIRPYFNTHAFSIDPSMGLLQRWLICFERLVSDRMFQLAFCQDKLHQVFLHQAVFSTLLVPYLKLGKIRILPSTYNYPYNLQSSIPYDRRERLLNHLVSLTYEDRSLDPNKMSDIQVDEPIKSWLLKALSLIEF